VSVERRARRVARSARARGAAGAGGGDDGGALGEAGVGTAMGCVGAGEAGAAPPGEDDGGGGALAWPCCWHPQLGSPGAQAHWVGGGAVRRVLAAQPNSRHGASASPRKRPDRRNQEGRVMQTAPYHALTDPGTPESGDGVTAALGRPPEGSGRRARGRVRQGRARLGTPDRTRSPRRRSCLGCRR